MRRKALSSSNQYEHSYMSGQHWSCSAYVPVSQLIYAALRSKAQGLFPPREECRRLGL